MSLPDKPRSPDTDETAAKDKVLSGSQPRVGYGSPPKHSQFKKSGNPGGRPKKPSAVDFDHLIIKLLESKLAHSDKTWLDLLITGLAKSAAQGDIRATKYLCELYLDAKRRGLKGTSDVEADQQAAERLFASLGPLASQIYSVSEKSKPNDVAPGGASGE